LNPAKCHGANQELNVIKAGFNAEIFAAVVTAGRALSSDGNRLVISRESIKAAACLGGGTAWSHGTGASLAGDCIAKSARQCVDAACTSCQSANPNCNEDLPSSTWQACVWAWHHMLGKGPNNICPHATPCRNTPVTGVDFDCADCKYEYEMPGDEVQTMMSYDYMRHQCSDYACFANLWFSMVSDTYQASELMLSTDLTGPEAPSISHMQWSRDGVNPNNHVKLFLSYFKDLPVVSGLNFQVLNTTAIQFSQDSCTSVMNWGFVICKGCICTINGKQQLMDGFIDHVLVAGDACSNWYVKLDKAFRGYIAALRASVLAMKTACCATPSGADFDGEAVICNNQRLPAASNNAASSVEAAFAAAPTGWEDVTSVYMSRLTSQCTDYAYADLKTLILGHFQSGRQAWQLLDEEDSTHELRELAKASLASRIVCSEKDTTKTLKERMQHRFAFSPVMGQQYFPPTITASGNVLTLGCGGTTQNLAVYSQGGNYQRLYSSWEEYNHIAKDPQGTDVSGTYGQFKMDGGKFADDYFDGGCPQAHSPKTCGGTLQCCKGCSECQAASRQGPKYRRNLSGSSSTCCPPQDFNAITVTTTEHKQITNTANQRIESSGTNRDQGNDRRCFHSQFGDTTSCSSEFHLQVLVCQTCDCTDAGKVQLVKVHTDHRLSTASAGCKPWFTLADAGMRTLIASVREDVIQEKLDSCSTK
jgi:hypothetical protein